jgi:hypothetical protein
MAVLLALVIGSCSSRASQTQTRLDISLDEIGTLAHFYDTPPESVKNSPIGLARYNIQGNAWKAILRELKQASPESLRHPRICASFVVSNGSDSDDEHQWVTYWIQDQPSVDAIGLKLSQNGPTVHFPVTEDYRESNSEDAASLVHFYCVHFFAPDSPEAQLIKNYPDARVVLIQDGEIVSTNEIPLVREDEGERAATVHNPGME